MTPLSIENIFKKHSKGLVYLAQKLIGDFYAEDVVSDCFIKLAGLDITEDHAEKLIYVMVKNKCLSVTTGHLRKYFRMYAVDRSVEISEDYADGLIMKAELMNFIVQKVDALPPSERKVFDLIYVQQFNAAESASILNLSVNTVRILKSRIDKSFKFFNVPIFRKNCWRDKGIHGYYLLPRFKKNKQ